MKADKHEDRFITEQMTANRMELLRHITYTSSQSMRLLNSMLSNINISFKEWLVLDILTCHRDAVPLTLSDISQKVAELKATLSRTLMEMENKKLIIRHHRGSDRRATYINITSQGTTHYEKGCRLIKAFLRGITQYLQITETEITVTSLAKVKNQLTWYSN